MWLYTNGGNGMNRGHLINWLLAVYQLMGVYDTTMLDRVLEVPVTMIMLSKPQ